MRLILCVEDEVQVLENNRKAFTDAGYSVITAENLAQAREQLATHAPDAIVLDIMLPDGLGLDWLAEIRKQGNKIPVIMLTAWDKPYDKARGLRLGANDYLGKPFEYDELLARVEVMFRNVEQIPEKITRGLLTLNPVSGQAFLSGVDLLLAKKEFALLLFFVQNENRDVSAEYLYEKVWGQDMNDDNNPVKISVSRLRKKIENSGYTINFDKDMDGYRFEKV
jgi:DNA-binding response OmpR family regulator